MAASATPNASAVIRSARLCPASRGRHTRSRTSAANAVRSSTVPLAPTSSNSVFATAAPACVDATPATTSSGAGTRPVSADAVDLPEVLALDEEQPGARVERRGRLLAGHGDL